ncbi:MAG: hypothetical protein A2W25_04265 [candidate division Zixibacteria bacterium RBG_16_53_22]|nr:MAG: hypothetical protein A2W25_04265 [candidate division Zixibacteria bacterium RBG_16_53_22]
MNKKGTKPCMNCGRAIGYTINFDQSNHEAPVLFCSLKCFKEFARTPKRGGIRIVKGTIDAVEEQLKKEG